MSVNVIDGQVVPRIQAHLISRYLAVMLIVGFPLDDPGQAREPQHRQDNP